MSCRVDRLYLISEKQEGKEGEKEMQEVGSIGVWRKKERVTEKDDMSVA